MIYTSKKGTRITIPDGLTAAQIAAIKADADAGYGTRAQQTADRLGAALNTTSTTTADSSFTTEGKSLAELQAMLTRTQAEIDKRGGAANAPTYASRLQQIQAAISKQPGQAPAGPAPGTVPDASGYQPGAQPQPAYPDTPFKDPGGPINKGTVDPKTGTINPVAASDDTSAAETHDVNTNFQLEHPQLITDENGNTREITRHADGTVTVKDTAGGISRTFKDLATAAAETFNGSLSRQRAEEATYGTLTKYYDRDMAREMEDQKQELANRGIPYDPAAAQDPNSKSLYGRTISGIAQRYQGLKDAASQQAILSGNQAYATDAAARDSFLNSVVNGASTFGGHFGPYSNSVSTDTSQDTKDILSLSADAYMKKYGIDQDTYTKKLAIAKSGSGGSGGSGSSKAKEPAAGFEIVG